MSRAPKRPVSISLVFSAARSRNSDSSAAAANLVSARWLELGLIGGLAGVDYPVDGAAPACGNRLDVIPSGGLFLLSAFSQQVGFASLGGNIRDSGSPVNDLATAFGVVGIGVLLDVSIAASFLACAIASTTALARVLFTMGREGLLPKAFGRAHPTFRTPFTAILVSVPVIAVVPIVAVFVGDGLWRTMEVLLVVAAAGYITAYILVCAAAPVFLKRIGEFTVWAGVRAGAASVLLTGVLVVYLVSEAVSSRAVGVWMFVVVMLLGVAAYRLRLRRRPWLRQTIGAWDEPIAADVLGGTDAAAR